MEDGRHSANINRMALSATLHCMAGCAIGEVMGMILGTAFGWSNAPTVVISTNLAFFFGFFLSIRTLLKAGVAFRTALGVVVAADTLSIATMELADNAVMLIIPGAMNAGLANPLFWITMPISLAVGFVVAFPVNRQLLLKGRGHALSMKYTGHDHHH